MCKTSKAKAQTFWCCHENCLASMVSFPTDVALAKHYAAAHIIPTGTSTSFIMYKIPKVKDLAPCAERFASIPKRSPQPSALPLPPAKWNSAKLENPVTITSTTARTTSLRIGAG